MRRAGVEPTTSSARTSPRCLRGGPRRSLYKRQHTLEDKGDLDSEKKSVQKSVQKSREFCFLACQKSHGMPQKKEKGFSMIVEISCYVFFLIRTSCSHVLCIASSHLDHKTRVNQQK